MFLYRQIGAIRHVLPEYRQSWAGTPMPHGIGSAESVTRPANRLGNCIGGIISGPLARYSGERIIQAPWNVPD